MNLFAYKLIVGTGGLGLFLILFAQDDLRIASVAAPTPHTITCEELINRGPGENAHILLTEYTLCDEGFVHSTVREGGDWQQVWIPAVPRLPEDRERDDGGDIADGTPSERAPSPHSGRDIHVIVESHKTPTLAEVRSLSHRNKLRGIVMNRIEKLGKEQRDLLAEQYPDIDFARVWIVAHEHPYASMPVRQATIMLYLGCFITALGFVLFVARLRSDMRAKALEVAASKEQKTATTTR